MNYEDDELERMSSAIEIHTGTGMNKQSKSI